MGLGGWKVGGRCQVGPSNCCHGVIFPAAILSGLVDVEEISIDELQRRMASGEISARELAQAYLDRIEQIDRSGPTLRSIIEINPDALEIANSLDNERARGHVRGPLHGIPIVIKDNIDTADRMQTTAGSLALPQVPVPNDAPVA